MDEPARLQGDMIKCEAAICHPHIARGHDLDDRAEYSKIKVISVLL